MVPTPDVAVPDINPVIPGIAAYEARGEEVLARRFQRKNIFNRDIVFEFTRDPALLHQYYEIRKNEYNLVYGKLFGVNEKYFLDGEDDYDRTGHILIIRKGNFCVGGFRINVKTPRNPSLLPVEINGFRIAAHFPELGYKQMSYGQVSGFVLLPEFRGSETNHKVFQSLYRKAVAMNIDMLFADVSPLHARIYHMACTGIGLQDIKIHTDIITPDIDGIDHVLFSAVINKAHSRKPLAIADNDVLEDLDIPLAL